MKKFSGLILSVLLLISAAQAQSAEVTIQLNEQFFDALLDALFKNMSPPEFPLAENREEEKGRRGEGEKRSGGVEEILFFLVNVKFKLYIN